MEKKAVKVVVPEKNHLTPLTVIRSLARAGYAVDTFLILKKQEDIAVQAIVTSKLHLGNKIVQTGKHFVNDKVI